MVFKGERDMLYNVAVCDDDEKDRQKMKEYLSKFGIQYDVDFEIDTFVCGEDLIDAYPKSQSKYHIIFLDMEMTGISGMETAKRIRELPDRNVLIVFVTSYPEFMQESFDVQASQYLIKSLEYDVFCDKMQKMLSYLNDLETHIKVVSKNGEEYVLHLEKIICFETIKGNLRNLLLVTTIDGEFQMRGKLSELENELQEKFFVSVHRTILVNLRYIKRFNAQSLEFTTGKVVPISRRRFQEIKDAYSKYMVMRYRK